MPVIQHTCSLLQAKLLDKIKSTNRTLQLAGDGRCDSPGISAKYCTYSLLDMESQHILTFVTIKVTETSSSCKMEVEGFRRCMEYLLDKGFQIVVLGTDRHVQIRSLMKKQYPEIEHQFDVWHLANSVRKKLLAKSKLRGAEDLGPWIKAICNHFWWCSSNSSGNKEWLEESFISIVHHVVNEHTFEGKMVTTCAHEPIAPEMARTKKWMKKGSKAHNALKEVVLNKRLRNDIKYLSEFCHTGNLEVYPYCSNMFQKGKNLMAIKWTQEQHWQLLITTCHKIEDKRLMHKDKAFIKRPTQKERENGLPNQFIIKSFTSG